MQHISKLFLHADTGALTPSVSGDFTKINRNKSI